MRLRLYEAMGVVEGNRRFMPVTTIRSIEASEGARELDLGMSREYLLGVRLEARSVISDHLSRMSKIDVFSEHMQAARMKIGSDVYGQLVPLVCEADYLIQRHDNEGARSLLRKVLALMQGEDVEVKL